MKQFSSRQGKRMAFLLIQHNNQLLTSISTVYLVVHSATLAHLRIAAWAKKSSTWQSTTLKAWNICSRPYRRTTTLHMYKGADKNNCCIWASDNIIHHMRFKTFASAWCNKIFSGCQPEKILLHYSPCPTRPENQYMGWSIHSKVRKLFLFAQNTITSNFYHDTCMLQNFGFPQLKYDKVKTSW
jgi:hypothetical protein